MQENSITSDKKYLQYLWKSYFDKNKSQKSIRPFSCNIKRPIDFQYKKSSPVYILRDELNHKKSMSKIEKSKYKSKKYLQQKLDDNCNVFMTGHEVDRRDLQNILWEKNYLLKSSINNLKEENNNIKAKVWNFEKENRKMQKQIDYWNLEKYPLLEGKNTPYLDSNTMDKVFQDQDYSVVTMKIELAKLTELMNQKDQQISRNNDIINNSKHYQELSNGRIALEAKKIMKVITNDNSSSLQQLKRINQKVKQNNSKILLLQEELSLAKNRFGGYLKQKRQLQKPIQPLLDIYKDIKLSFKTKPQQLQEPSSRLRTEVDHQRKVIDDLEYNIQQIINESLTQKQSLRKRIKQLQKQLVFQDQFE